MAPKGEKPHPEGKYRLGDRKGRPTPARHIPWPEVFKHHQSVVDGHVRMLEMVQKHCVPDSDNWNTITPLVGRAKEMSRATKQTTQNFIPSDDHFKRVPLGSTSDSMYPGYSPGDLEYGAALREAGEAITKAKSDGKTWKPPAEYEVGQSRGGKRTKYFVNEQEGAETVDNGVSGDTSRPSMSSATSNRPRSTPERDDDNTQGSAKDDDADEHTVNNPYFVVDTAPTPVKNSETYELANRGKKRSAADTPPHKTISKKHKKGKKQSTDSNDSLNDANATNGEQVDNNDAEVQARLEARESKRKLKEKKRQRESDDSMFASQSGDRTDSVQKPKKKKSKKDDGDLVSRTLKSESVHTEQSKESVKRPDAEDEETRSKKKKKKVTKS